MFKFLSEYIDYISLMLCLIIFTLLIVGCQKSNVERFENKPLTDFQSKVINDVKNGKINGKVIAKYIQDNKLTKDDLNNIVQKLASFAVESEKKK
jgi:hypothetical protein